MGECFCFCTRSATTTSQFVEEFLNLFGCVSSESEFPSVACFVFFASSSQWINILLLDPIRWKTDSRLNSILLLFCCCLDTKSVWRWWLPASIQTSSTFKPTISSSLHTEVAVMPQSPTTVFLSVTAPLWTWCQGYHGPSVWSFDVLLLLLPSEVKHFKDERILEQFLHTGQELNDNLKPLSPTLMALLYRGTLFYFW